MKNKAKAIIRWKDLTTEQYIFLAKKVHGNIYDYSQVKYNGLSKKIKIICPTHGESLQFPKKHINTSGCKKCGREKSDNPTKVELKTKKEKKLAKKAAELFYEQFYSSDSVCEELNIGSNNSYKYGYLKGLLKKYDLYRDNSDRRGMNTRRYNVNEKFFDNIDTEEKAYILGFIYADGNIDQPPNNKLNINLQEKDIHILEDIRRIMEFDGIIGIYDTKKTHIMGKKLKSVQRTARMCISHNGIYNGLLK